MVTHRPSQKKPRTGMCPTAKRPKADSYGTVVRSHCTLLLTLLTKTRFVPILFPFPQLFLSTISDSTLLRPICFTVDANTITGLCTALLPVSIVGFLGFSLP